MKAIMISDKAKWCALMMNGIKKIEVRKNKALASAIKKLINENGYADIYVYCSKDGGNLVYGTEYRGGNFVDEYGITRGYSKQKANEIFGLLNGKVLFKFRCYKVEEISWQIGVYELEQQSFSDFLDKCCLGFCELKNYLNKKNGYAIHISDLEIFNRPRELSEFHKVGYEDNAYDEIETMVREIVADLSLGDCFNGTAHSIDEDELWKQYETIVEAKYKITKAPQNMVYVEVEK